MNDSIKPEAKQEENGIEIPLLSSKPRKLLVAIIMGFFLGYLLLSIFLDKPKNESKKVQSDVPDLNFYPAPKLQNNAKVNSITPENSSPNNNSIEENPDKKLMMLRQHAPIQMYLVEKSKVELQETHRVNIKSEGELNSMKVNTQRNEEKETNPISGNDNSNANTKSSTSNDGKNEVERLKHQDFLLLEGTIIPAILQTAVHSDLAGNLKAVINDDIYAAKGRRILIPKGSSLLGHYSGTVQQEQSRIIVVWTRIIRPDGISIKLQAEGTDEVGQAGLTGNVNHHFLTRFGQASLLSLLGVGIASSSISPSEIYTLSLANGFASTSKDSLQVSSQIKPTITIKAGSSVAVYVNHDISFYDTLH